MKKLLLLLTLLAFINIKSEAAYMLIPMDEETQKDHLKAYGITYWVLDKEVE